MRFLHCVLRCPISKQSVHRGGARPIGCEAVWIASCAWSDWPSDTWFGVDISAGVSLIVTPFSKATRFVDLLRLDVCFTLAARKSLHCSAKNALLCIATSHPLIIWSNARFVGLTGLCGRCRRSAFTEDACLSNYAGFWGVFSENSLPLLPGGVGVFSWISSVSITVLGLNGTKPAAAKLFFIVSAL